MWKRRNSWEGHLTNSEALWRGFKQINFHSKRKYFKRPPRESETRQEILITMSNCQLMKVLSRVRTTSSMHPSTDLMQRFPIWRMCRLPRKALDHQMLKLEIAQSSSKSMISLQRLMCCPSQIKTSTTLNRSYHQQRKSYNQALMKIDLSLHQLKCSKRDWTKS